MRFNLRQKVFLHFFIFMIVNGVIWFFSYYSHSIINQKLIVIEKKKDLLDTVLEARRYEKNFFLKKNREDLIQALSYITKIEQKQKIIENSFAHILEDKASVGKKTQIIQAYKKEMENLYFLVLNSEKKAVNKNQLKKIQETITQIGRKLTTEIEQVETLERAKVFMLIERSKNYLLTSLFFLFILTILTAFFLIKNFNRPLRAIEKNIQRIVSGDFHKLPEESTGDEFASLARSLNNMIEELDKRNHQLVQAEKMSSLGTLTSGVAHELNNPLNNISTSIQIIAEELEESNIEYKRKLLYETEQQIDRARDIIKALLEFSRQNDFFVECVNFKDLVQSTMHLIMGEIPVDIELKIDVPDDVSGKMDSRRIQQVLLNLILNGVHAMPRGGELKITAFRDENNKSFVFEVSDTGQGISPSDSVKIFDPFFTTKEIGKGSGLGLSISHGIIEQHDGSISVDSIEGEGSTFTVRLPD